MFLRYRFNCAGNTVSLYSETSLTGLSCVYWNPVSGSMYSTSTKTGSTDRVYITSATGSLKEILKFLYVFCLLYFSTTVSHIDTGF